MACRYTHLHCMFTLVANFEAEGRILPVNFLQKVDLDSVTIDVTGKLIP